MNNITDMNYNFLMKMGIALMLVLLECVDGYYLYEKKGKYELKRKKLFENNLEALNEVKLLQKSKPSDLLINFLKGEELFDEIMVFDQKLAKKLNEKEILAKVGDVEIYREIKRIHEDFNKKLPNSLFLTHQIASEKVKNNNNDMMIIQSIRLIEDIDKDINNQCMRIREWYGMHFPELGAEISDNISYLEMIKKIGHKEKLKKDFDEKILALSKISVGTKISDDDLKRILENADNVIEMSNYRKELALYLKEKMSQVAPNLAFLLGDQLAAKLISHCGSFANLVKIPASTFQILGAEKSLFNALRTKSNTPKYGFLYYAPIISTTNAPNKGRMARMLAAKASLLARIDFYGENKNTSAAQKVVSYLEKRKERFEKIKKPQSNLIKCKIEKTIGMRNEVKRMKK